MFWVILIIIVLFIGFVIDKGTPSKYSERDRNREGDKGKLPSGHQVSLPKTEATTSVPKGQLEKKGSAEEKCVPAPSEEPKARNAINRDAERAIADDLAKSHGGEYLLAEKITESVAKYINSQESAIEFVLQELDGASKGSDEARTFAKSLGFLEGEYAGALRKQANEDVENAQQALLKSSISLSVSPELTTRLRLFNVKNIIEKWCLNSPEIKKNRLLKALREIALDDVNLVPSLDASLPIIKTASIKHISNRNKNLDFAKTLLTELRQSLNKSPREIILLAVPEILEDYESRQTNPESPEKSVQKAQKPEATIELAYESDIKSFVEEREIPYLVHFTDFRNLPGIMSEGLVPRLELETAGRGFYYNDEMRLDRVKGSISTSIAFPNYKMFFRYRQQANVRRWALLIIDKSVFWENECLFCAHNAADRRIIHANKSYLASPAALEKMYDIEAGNQKRDFSLLKSYDPTDPQAEVLVLSTISPDKIHTVVFDSLSSKERFSQYYPMKKAVVDTAFFSSRDYVRRRQVI
ncbi:DarT ssDNA thymidine ADP-ribosyltransferase family protein [Halomonas sp. HAL1]|uniref:DarT ssDNA thymidine ADP-ribosyltransferase family protein n=1 Tax=Halomonas sp. HAL1 TaxID=550984 RepID=UPI00022D34B2|nr:DarT ssDNA thymidine ADP-ribosyltransferase family protein [Halomonas sp. HAL1]EHA16770.1 hypothetical protein HAL1_04591 [Halomonas sp. HAL1]WKV94741.1 DarT ssDNA thymidine ADP-ribosyltransferase family protein [Halomonas sp. HAL1]